MDEQPEHPARRDTDIPPDAPWWARLIIGEWRSAWKWLSVQVAFLIGAGAELQALAPDFLNQYASPQVQHHIMGALAVLVILGRIKNQEPKT